MHDPARMSTMRKDMHDYDLPIHQQVYGVGTLHFDILATEKGAEVMGCADRLLRTDFFFKLQ